MPIPLNTLKDKTALVTGAALRIGRATACALADQGANVVIHYRSSVEEAAKLAEELRTRNVEAWTVHADFEKNDETATLVERAVEAAGQIDMLVSNAGIFPDSTLADFSMEEVERTCRVNALSPLVIARAFARQGNIGSIVHFLDTRITDYDPAHFGYLLSKRLLYTITRILALELAPRVRVNAVAPGTILPPPGKDEEYLELKAQENPLQSYGSTDDIARAVLFLLASDFITGQVIFVDGGQHLTGCTF